jgi:hypothetical protein
LLGSAQPVPPQSRQGLNADIPFLDVGPLGVNIQAVIAPKKIAADISSSAAAGHRIYHDIKGLGQPEEQIDDGLAGDLAGVLLSETRVAIAIIPNIVEWRLLGMAQLFKPNDLAMINNAVY